MGWWDFSWSTKNTFVAILCTFLCFIFAQNYITRTMEPTGKMFKRLQLRISSCKQFLYFSSPITSSTLDDKLILHVFGQADRTALKGIAGSTHCVVLVPTAVQSRIIIPTELTNSTPLALPIPLRDVVQWRIHAVNVKGNVTVIAEEETSFIMSLSTTFANCAVQTSPPFLQKHFRHLH